MQGVLTHPAVASLSHPIFCKQKKRVEKAGLIVFAQNITTY
jgi:hypothetical protein